ncbi:UNVERIFIED_CONTAM: Myelin transcription factor 1-like protein [Trichonephila clavipes]
MRNSSSSNDGSPVNSGSYVSFPVGSKAAKIFQPVKRQRLSTEESEKNGDVENDEEIRVLEDEILELQEYNAKVESEMIKLRTDISQMEQHIRITERDNQSLVQKNHSLSEYYETLRNNFISLLDHVKLPNFDERPSRENFDAYLKRIQTLCTDSCGEENKAVLSAIKQALQDFNFPINGSKPLDTNIDCQVDLGSQRHCHKILSINKATMHYYRASSLEINATNGWLRS